MADNDWKKRLAVVYATNRDYEYEYQPQEEVQTLPPGKQRLLVGIDRRNRAGKTVTLVSGFKGSADDLTDLCKTLKTKCGCGGSAKDGDILLQGDLRDKAVAILSSMGYNSKRSN